jgi:hypothetical protein
MCYDRYWAALLLNMSVDIRAYDIRINPRNCWSKVRYGGPEVLLNPKLHGKGRTRYYDSRIELYLLLIKDLRRSDDEGHGIVIFNYFEISFPCFSP